LQERLGRFTIRWPNRFADFKVGYSYQESVPDFGQNVLIPGRGEGMLQLLQCGAKAVDEVGLRTKVHFDNLMHPMLQVGESMSDTGQRLGTLRANL
jgi:hypothetical protein